MRFGIDVPITLSPMRYEGAVYISFDPGKVTGVVQWDGEGNPIAFHHFNEDQLNEFLDLVEDWPVNPNCFIYEEYRIYGSVNHTGSKVHTIQIIGTIQRVARKLKAKIVEIRADKKGIAALWSGTKIPKGHMEHWMAAYLVGYFHLHMIGIIKARVLDDKAIKNIRK